MGEGISGGLWVWMRRMLGFGVGDVTKGMSYIEDYDIKSSVEDIYRLLVWMRRVVG